MYVRMYVYMTHYDVTLRLNKPLYVVLSEQDNEQIMFGSFLCGLIVCFQQTYSLQMIARG